MSAETESCKVLKLITFLFINYLKIILNYRTKHKVI